VYCGVTWFIVVVHVHRGALQRCLASVHDPCVGVSADPATTGAWCIAEVLSDDWLSSLADSLSAHFTKVTQEQYFDEVFSGHVEVCGVPSHACRCSAASLATYWR
jgi:hypothetical protein